MFKRLRGTWLATGALALALLAPGAALAQTWGHHDRDREHRHHHHNNFSFSIGVGPSYGHGYYDNWGYYHPYGGPYGYYDRWGYWHPR